MLGGMTFAQRRYRNARLATIAMVLTAVVIGVSSCEGDEADGAKQARGGETAQAQVVRSDTTQCAMSSTLLTNRGDGAVSVHLTVENKCSGPNIETIGPPYEPARVRVLDRDGNVVNGQDYRIPAMQSDDSRLGVPPGARIVLDCAKGFVNVRHGCIWSYTYSP
jgi:hypothetical protein